MDISTSPATRKLVVGSSVVALLLSVAALIVIPSALRNILSEGFLPHQFCYLNNKQLIALHVGTDAVIWLSYVAISFSLIYLVWRTRREIPFSWMFLAFGLFIVACGFTHFMEVVVLWKPLYWLAGDVKLVTALASFVTAVTLPGLIPQAHATITSAHLSENRRQQLELANSELQQLSARVMSVQDAERRRIARELHDGVGQYLAAIKMSTEVALKRSKRADIAAPLYESINLLDRCMVEVRTMSYLLHPPLLEEIGLASAIPWLVDGFMHRSGVQVDLKMPEHLERLLQPVELALFRVLQESLTNIHRHSESKVAEVSLRILDNRALLSVKDRGKGFASDDGHAASVGVGIAGMRERIRELGGELRVNSGSGGTTVEASIPLQVVA
ncbi:MAG TPA: sensor histidine kinase [Candidatus Acidoferrum sp.]|jgi:signal transduction histidine kinase